MSARSPMLMRGGRRLRATLRSRVSDRVVARTLWLALLWFTPPAQAFGACRIVSVERLPDGRLSLVFHEAGPEALDYRLTHQPQPGETVENYLDFGCRIVDLGEGYYQTVIPRPPHSPRFYRVAGFAGPDTDGDGLSDALEELIGTSPTSFDTDEDGFGDGVELVYGGNPLDPDVVPSIPQAGFVLTSSSAREGGGTLNLEVAFSAAFSGTLLFEIADMSTAVSGEDFAPVSGTVTVDGAVALIPITFLDDGNIEPLKLLVVDLVEDPWGDYRVGGASRHMVRIHDNDAYWSGVMGTDDSAQLGFRLRLVREGGVVTEAALVSELSADRRQGVGTIPVGVWPVTATLTSNSFHAVSAPIPMGASLLTGDVELQRRFIFTADGGNTNHTIRSNIILGEFIDRLEPVDPAMGWIGGEVGGVVALMEDLPVPGQATEPAGSGDAGLAMADGGVR